LERTEPILTELMEQDVERENLIRAWKRVRANKGSPGIDGMTVDDLTGYLKEKWARIREELLSGEYRPQPVREVLIPKPDGGTRRLGIPTVVDRLIQQAIQQVLGPVYDPTFSEHSYGFRPRRRAHQAVEQAKRYIAEGYEWVVDMDLEKFFDRVNHDILMVKLAGRIGDKRVLRIIRRYLQAGIMVNGVVQERWEGTPQGVHYPRCSATFFWMNWIRSWNGEDTGFAGTPMMRIFTSSRSVPENGYLLPSRSFYSNA